MHPIVYHVKLRWLFRRLDASDKVFDRLLFDARKKNEGHDRYREIMSEGIFEHDQIQGSIDFLTTRYLLRRARHLMIAAPDLNESRYWSEEETGTTARILSRHGIAYLRAEIRAELKERRESWTHWFTLLIGLVGTLTGLVAVIVSQ